MGQEGIILTLDYIGTFVFAISGAIVAVEKQFDFFGAIILAFVTSIGGGTLRDLLIGSTPVGWMESDIHIYIILSTIPATYFLMDFFRRLRRTFFLFDTIGIGLFTILGMEKVLAMGLSPVVAIMMGVVSAVFGGVLRDVLSNQAPLIFRKEIYAFACLFGALVYYFLRTTFDYNWIGMLVSIGVVITIRVLAIRYQWSIPFRPLRRK